MSNITNRQTEEGNCNPYTIGYCILNYNIKLQGDKNILKREDSSYYNLKMNSA